MLRIHFLNVGHGDCTIIKHHSGRLTMIDINNSQDYDEDSLKDFLAEKEAKKKNLLPLMVLPSRPSINVLPPRPATSGLTLRQAISGLPTRPAISDVLPPPNSLLELLRRSAADNTLPTPQSSLAQFAERLAAAREASKELTDPIEFLQKNYPGEGLWRFILTHPDLDHMRGIKKLFNNITVVNFWDTDHTKPAPDFKSDADKEDWEFYQKLRNGSAGSNRRVYTRGACLFAFGKDENGQPGGDNIKILSPTTDLVRFCNSSGKSNSLSLVLRVSHAGRSVLLPGDVEDDAWEIMTAFYGSILKSDFLKASHHGRDTGYNLKAVQLISPILTFVSVGRKPDTDASGEYRQQCQRVASTRYYGNMTVEIYDNGQYGLFVERNFG